MDHKWNGRPIVDSKHHEDLENASAHHEFIGKLPKDAAEDAAYVEYKQKQHLEAAGHHLHNLRNAVSSGAREEGEKHNTLLKMHSKALGLNPHQPPTPEIQHAAANVKSSARFKNHPADVLLAHGPMGKAERQALDYYELAKADVGAQPGDPKPTEVKPAGSPPPTAPKAMAAPTVHGLSGKGDSEPQKFNQGSVVVVKQTPTSHVPPDWIGTVSHHHLIKVHTAQSPDGKHLNFYEIDFHTPSGKVVQDFLPQDILIAYSKSPSPQ